MVEGFRDVELSAHDLHLFQVRCGYNNVRKVLDEFSASLVKKVSEEHMQRTRRKRLNGMAF